MSSLFNAMTSSTATGAVPGPRATSEFSTDFSTEANRLRQAAARANQARRRDKAPLSMRLDSPTTPAGQIVLAR